MFRKWLLLLLFLAPILLSLVWGRHLSSEAAVTARYARNYAGGLGFTYNAPPAQEIEPISAPLYTAIVALLTRLGLDPLLAALLTGAVGWGLAALALAFVGAAIGQPWGGAAAGALLAFSPAVFGDAGRPFGWIIAFSWLTLVFALQRRWPLTLLFAVLLATFFMTWPLAFAWPSGLAGPLLWSLLLVIVCCGVSWLAPSLAAAGVPPRRMRSALLAAVILLLGGWQAFQVNGLFAARVPANDALLSAAANWIRTQTPAGATLLASEELGVLAARQTLVVPDVPPAEMPERLRQLLADNPVDLVVAENDLGWDLVRDALWFRLAYAPQQEISVTNTTTAPLTIFAYRPPQADLGPREVLNARVPDHLSVLGYQLGPQIAQAGDIARLRLSLQAPQASNVPRRPFEAIVRLISPVDGAMLAEWTAEFPRANALETWAQGQVIDEEIALPLPADLAGGGYLLNLSLIGQGESELWPFSFNNDVNRLDRIPVAWLAVPQRQQPPIQEPLDVAFDSRITLSGINTGIGSPGSNLELTLFWQPTQSIGEDYVVFVHVFDEEGQLVASHDGRPAAGQFPTTAWQPGLTIVDTHLISLPADLPPGIYTLSAGLYDPETGVRLLLSDVNGTPASGDAADLGQIEIR